MKVNMKVIKDVNIGAKGELTIKYEDGTTSKTIVPKLPMISVPSDPTTFAVMSLANIIMDMHEELTVLRDSKKLDFLR